MSLAQETLYNVVRCMPASAEGVEEGFFLLCILFLLIWIYGKKEPNYTIVISDKPNKKV